MFHFTIETSWLALNSLKGKCVMKKIFQSTLFQVYMLGGSFVNMKTLKVILFGGFKSEYGNHMRQIKYVN